MHLSRGVTTVNGKVARPDTIIRNGDRIEFVSCLAAFTFCSSMLNSEKRRNVVHRHEPPVTLTPVKVLFHDKEREFLIINKPGSIVRAIN